MDCVLIQHGKAHEIWRNRTKASLQGTITPELYIQIVEVAGNTVNGGDVWNGTTFTAPPAPPPPPLPPSLDQLARDIPRHVRALVLYYLRDKLQRNPAAAERQAAIEALVQAYKDVEP